MDTLFVDLKGDVPEIRESAARSLTKYGMPTIDPLLELLKHDDVYFRWRAAWILGRHSENQVIQIFDALIEAVSDPAPEVKWCAVNSLGIIKNKKAVGSLIPVLKDSDAGIRSQAAKSLETGRCASPGPPGAPFFFRFARFSAIE